MKARRLGRCLFILVALWGTSCAHKVVLEKPLKNLQPTDFWKDQAARRAVLGTFSAKLKMGYQGRDTQVAGRGRAVGDYPKAFRFELRDPLGRLHYVLTSKGSELTAYYPREKRAFQEQKGGRAYFKHLLGMEVRLADWVALSVGVLPPQWEKQTFQSWEWDKEVGAFHGVLQKGTERLNVWVDSGNAALQKLLWETPNQQRVEARYSDWGSCCDKDEGFYLAHEVKMAVVSQNTSIEVSWDSLSRPKQAIPPTAYEFTPQATDKVTHL